jgi:tetratricopeptide (TPR) repeat protein
MDSKSFNTYYYYGNAEYVFGNCATALSLFEKAKDCKNKESPHTSDYYRIRGSIKACLNDTIEALENFNKSIELDSSNYKTYLKRISFLNSNVKYIAQIKNDIGKLLKTYPNKKDIPFLYAMQGFYSVISGDTLQAEEFYKKAVEISPDKGYPYYNLASYYFFFRKKDEYKTIIFEALKKSILFEKNRFDTYKFLAIAYAVIDNDSENGCKIIKKAEKQFGNMQDIIRLKEILCKGKEGIEDMRLEYLIIPNGETELLNVFFGNQTLLQLNKNIN